MSQLTDNSGQEEVIFTPEEKVVTKPAKKSFMPKLTAFVKNAFSAQNVKRTVALLVTTVVVVVVVVFVLSYFSAESVAERYIVISIFNDHYKIKKYVAFDYYAYLLKDQSEEEFFEEKSDYYKEDIHSWKELARVSSTYERDEFEETCGETTITANTTRVKDISIRRLNEDYEETLKTVSQYSFDIDDVSDAKVATVKMKYDTEEGIFRQTYEVVLLKIKGFWKVLEIKQVS